MPNFYAKTPFCLRCWEVSKNSVTRKNPNGRHISLDSEPQSILIQLHWFGTLLCLDTSIFKRKSRKTSKTFQLLSSLGNHPHITIHRLPDINWKYHFIVKLLFSSTSCPSVKDSLVISLLNTLQNRFCGGAQLNQLDMQSFGSCNEWIPGVSETCQSWSGNTWYLARVIQIYLKLVQNWASFCFRINLQNHVWVWAWEHFPKLNKPANLRLRKNTNKLRNKPIQDGGDADAPLWLNQLTGTD